MTRNRTLRFSIIFLLLTICVVWSLSRASAEGESAGYPRAEFLATADWLKAHAEDPGVVVVDVRTDEHFDGELIPGAIRLPWSNFREDAPAMNIGSLFAGPKAARKVLGDTGVVRTDEIVLYDSVKRDGGATASYVFWVLDILGHEKKRVLNGGIDAWRAAGYERATTPAALEPRLYQAPAEEIRAEKLVRGAFVHDRLGDPMYQIIDVRSREEYLGRKGTKDLFGNGLELGHIPTAVNVNYEDAWVDTRTKKLKSYSALQERYRGLDETKGVIVYCNSGRRSSFSYFVLRLMGIDQVITYEASWKEWGNPDYFFPVETREHRFAGTARPGTSRKETAGGTVEQTASAADGPESASGGQPSGGYVSCGG